MYTLNLENIILYYLTKLLERGDLTTMSMTLEQLQTDIKIVNGLLSAVQQFLPQNMTQNSVISFLEAADQNVIVQNIILLVINNVTPAAANPGIKTFG